MILGLREGGNFSTPVKSQKVYIWHISLHLPLKYGLPSSRDPKAGGREANGGQAGGKAGQVGRVQIDVTVPLWRYVYIFENRENATFAQ